MLACVASTTLAYVGPARGRGGIVSPRVQRSAVVMDDGPAVLEDGPAPIIQDMSTDIGQIYGPTAPAHPWAKPWTNLYEQEAVQLVKARSQLLKQPLKVEQHGHSAPLGSGHARLLRLRRARLAALGGSLVPGAQCRPLGAQPPPPVPELAVSRDANCTAL